MTSDNKIKLKTEHSSTYLSRWTKECPVCGKTFIIATNHIYHDKLNQKVCSYTCARKSGGM